MGTPTWRSDVHVDSSAFVRIQRDLDLAEDRSRQGVQALLSASKQASTLSLQSGLIRAGFNHPDWTSGSGLQPVDRYGVLASVNLEGITVTRK